MIGQTDLSFVTERLNYYPNRDHSRTLYFQKRTSNIQTYGAPLEHHVVQGYCK